MVVAPDITKLRSGDRLHEYAAAVLIGRLKLMSGERFAARLDDTGSAVSALNELAETSALATPSESDVDEALATARDWKDRRYDVRFAFDPDYPRNLWAIYNRPAFVFVRGQWLEERDSLSIAVVGTRQASAEGLHRAARAARVLA